MTISEFISELEKTKSAHGDVDVVLDDADTRWIFELQPTHLVYRKEGNRVEIRVSYDDKTIS